MKKLISLLLVCVLGLSTFAILVNAEDVESETPSAAEYTTASQTVGFVIADQHWSVPVRIAPAVLHADGQDRDVYLIGLMGVKSNKNQVNNSKNLFPVAYNKENTYEPYVVSLIFDLIPEGSALVFVGHSLGGMVAQQLRTDEKLTGAYDVVAVLTAGSPLILVDEEKTEGGLERLVDKWDVITYLSPATYKCLKKQLGTAHRENGGYFFNPDGAHNKSYLRDEIWGKYDALGVEGGSATISVDLAKQATYGAA